MKRLLVIILALMASTFVQAQADELSERRELMKSISGYMKILKGQTQTFDANIVATEATKIAETFEALKSLFDEKGTGETFAKDAIWDDFDAFLAGLNASMEAAQTAGTSTDIDMFNANFKKLSRSCGGCHRNFRVKK